MNEIQPSPTRVERPDQINTIEEAIFFLSWAQNLGETITPEQITKLKLREDNFRVLDILEDHFKSQKSPVKEGKWAIVIPAYKEKDIANLLGDLFAQLALIPRDSWIGFTKTEIIISINNEEENGITQQAIQEFLAKHELPPGISLKILRTEKQGKLVAFDHALEYLEKQPKFPQHLYFFDADSRIKPGGLSAMHNLLSQRKNQAVGAKVVVPPHPRNIREAIAFLPLKGHGEKGVAWLQGGAFAINHKLAPLFHAYVHAFPGFFANDVNWSVVLHEKNIPFRLTSKPYLIMEPPGDIAELVRQQNRWLQGSRQTSVFCENSVSIINTSVFKKAMRIVKNYFPGFPKISLDQFKQFISQGVKKELWGMPFFTALYLAIDHLKEPIILSIQGKKIKVGGPPPNPYRPRGWQPPRPIF